MMEHTRSTLLAGARVARGPNAAIQADVEIANGRVRAIAAAGRNACAARGGIDLSGYLLLPGLINAHDHLEFNLFPRLGNGPYRNSKEWAEDIFNPGAPPIRQQLSVAKADRLRWGGLKNLLSGVTTVCHHNPYDAQTFEGGFPVRVVSRYGWAHSLAFESRVRERYDRTPPGAPFVIHLAEGVDGSCAEEIFELDRLGALGSRTVLVHGVGLSPRGQAMRTERGAQLVWCPTSNRFLFGRTLDIAVVAGAPGIALGSDSALTAQGDLLDEIHDAAASVPAEAVYAMVTDAAAKVLRLEQLEGTIEPGGAADLVAIPWTGRSPAEALARATWREIELVLVGGAPRLLSLEMRGRWSGPLEGLERMDAAGVPRLVRAEVSRMTREAAAALGRAPILAGKEVAA